jgi:hypothetical protein
MVTFVQNYTCHHIRHPVVEATAARTLASPGMTPS